MTFVTLSVRYERPRIGVGYAFLRAPAKVDRRNSRQDVVWNANGKSGLAECVKAFEVEAVHDDESSGAIRCGALRGRNVDYGLRPLHLRDNVWSFELLGRWRRVEQWRGRHNRGYLSFDSRRRRHSGRSCRSKGRKHQDHAKLWDGF